MMPYFLLFLCLLLSATSIAAESPRVIELGPKMNKTFASFTIPSSDVVIWAEGKRGEFAYSNLEHLNWKRFTLPHNSGAGREPVWYRFSVKNTDNVSQHYVLSSVEGHIADFAVLHIRRGESESEIKTFYSGSKVPQTFQPTLSTDLEFHFNLEPNSTAELTLGISSIYNRNLLYQIATLAQHSASRQAIDLLFGVSFGVCLFALGLNLAIWLALKQNFYLAYAVTNGFALVAQFIGIGYVNLLLPEKFSIGSPEVLISLIPITIAMRMWFTRDFLGIKSFSRVLWIGANVLIFAGLGIAIFNSSSQFTSYSTLVTSIYGAVAGIFALFLGFVGVLTKTTKFAVYYLFGLTATFVGGIIWQQGFVGSLTPTTLVMHQYMVGTILENATLAFVFLRQLKEINRQANKADAKTHEAERMNMLIRVMNHDLRNYVTIIKGAGERMRKESNPSNNLEKLANRIGNAVNRQLDVLSSVQKLVNLEHKKQGLQLEPIDIHPVMTELKELFQQSSDEKQIRLSISASRLDPIYVMADRKMLLGNVLSNVLHNAIKYSHPGSHIAIHTENSPSEITITIRDQGIGISNINLKRLFNPDQTTSRPGTNGETGSGFGLTICKSYMELFNGSIEIESKTIEESPNDHGTKVSLKLKHAPRSDLSSQLTPVNFLPQTRSDLNPE